MYAAVSTPDVARPYRVVDAQTAGGLSSQTGDPTIDRIKSGEFHEDPNAVFVPKYGPPPKQFKLSNYAWVGQKQMPVGCPYPYPAMPVPIADYTSGRWLDADYVPSIPLPPPYDQTPWQCSVPEAPGKPHRGPSHYSGVEHFTPPPPATANPIPSPVDVLLADPKPDPAKVKSALENSVRRADELRRSVDLALRNGNRTRAAVLQGQLDAVESDRRLLTQLKSRLEAEHGKPKVGARPSNGDVGLPPPTGSAAPRSGDGDSRDDPESQTHDDGVHYATPKAPAPGPDRLYAQPKDPPPPAPAPAPTPPPGIPPATRSAVKNPCDINGPDGEKLLGIEPGSDSTIGGQDVQKADLEKAARSTSGGKEMKADSIRLDRRGAGGAMPSGSPGRGASVTDRWAPRVPSESDQHVKLSTSDGLPIDVYAGRTELVERVLRDGKPRNVRGDELEAEVGFYIGVKGQPGHAYQFAQYVSVAAVQYKRVDQAELTNFVSVPRWHLDAEDYFGSRDYHDTWFQTQGVDRETGASLMFDMPGSRYSRADVLDDDRAFEAVTLMLESGGMTSGTAEKLARVIVGSNAKGLAGGWVKETKEFRTYIIDTSEHSCGRRTIGVLSFKCSFLFDFAGNKRMTKPEFSGFKFEPMGSQRLR